MPQASRCLHSLANHSSVARRLDFHARRLATLPAANLYSNQSRLTNPSFLSSNSCSTLNSPCHRLAVVGPPFDLTRNAQVPSRVSVRSMASGDKKFPPQEQKEQPGREHEMQPIPEFVRPNYKPADKLLGKVAVVTGGDSGIGRSVACHFALEGASVAITYVPDVEEKDAEDTLQLLNNQYKHPHVKAHHIKIPVDLGFDENCKKVVQQVIDTYKSLDILVNNAGEQWVVSEIENISTEQVERVFRTNIFSQFYLTKYAINHMKEGSCIINTTSVNAYKGNASLLDYTSTKGAIVAFTRGLALHVVGRGIRVNGVAPGPIWTPLIPSSFPSEKTESFGEQVPMKRAGQPSEVGPSYVFLASEDSSYYTGQVLHPNGGTVVNA